jgi:putative ABC transport system substrate-binding protein
LGLIFLIEFFSHGSDLPMFELGDLDRAPSLGGSDQRTEHQLQDGSLSPNASLRLKVHVVHTVAERDFDAAFDDLDRAQASALLVFPDALFTDVRRRLAELATRHKMPVLYPDRSYVEVGGLMSYGSSRSGAFREAGIYVGRILRGENLSDLPVMQATKFELVINLKTAKALGLEIPATLLALADEVIE